MDSEYIVSARKYRPKTFETVVGQQALTATLKNAIIEHKLAHAYLFCGPRGVGKTTCARIFAKTINCEHRNAEGEACNECESCRSFNETRSMNIYEMDAASNNSIEDIKQIIEQVHIPPQIGKYKVFIIDEVHMLSTKAFNAFLKTLEEPPAHVIFILATTEKQAIIPTILSRCQIYDFNRMNIPDITSHLEKVAHQEGYKFDNEGLNIIAQKADGSMRDALSILDQAANFTQGEIYYKKVIQNLNVLDYEYYFQLTEAFWEHNLYKPLLIFNQVLKKGFEGNHFISGLAEHLRNLLVCQDPSTIGLLEVSPETQQRYNLQAQKCDLKFLYEALILCNNCSLNYPKSNNKRLLVELTLIQISKISNNSITQQKEIPSVAQTPSTIKKQENKSVSPSTRPTATQPISPQRKETGSVLRAQQPPQKNLGISSFKNLLTDSEPGKNIDIDKEKDYANKTSSNPSTEQKDEQKSLLPIDDVNVNIEWIRYANALSPSESLLASRMKVIKPQQQENNIYNIIVNNEQMEELFKLALPNITQYFGKKFKESVTFNILRQNVEGETQVEKDLNDYTSANALKHYIKTYKAISQLQEGFNLEII